MLDHVVAAADLDAAEIGRRRREHPRRHEMALLDQVRHVGGKHHDVEHAAQAAAVSTGRRGGQTDDDGVGTPLQQPAIGPRDRVVALVDDARGQLHATVEDSGGERLDRRHLHAGERCRTHPGLDDAVKTPNWSSLRDVCDVISCRWLTNSTPVSSVEK